ncbi:MAG: phosphopantetheine-binding protein [Byssovorax sp.]
MVPQAFVTLDQFPLTPSGSVDRRALPAPDLGALVERAKVALAASVEEGIAGIFAEILKLPVEQVGAHDGFFELGGHSLLGTQVIARARSAFQVDLLAARPLRAPHARRPPPRSRARFRRGQGLDLPPLARAAAAATATSRSPSPRSASGS